jgi:hypothetical protein
LAAGHRQVALQMCHPTQGIFGICAHRNPPFDLMRTGFEASDFKSRTTISDNSSSDSPSWRAQNHVETHHVEAHRHLAVTPHLGAPPHLVKHKISPQRMGVFRFSLSLHLFRGPTCPPNPPLSVNQQQRRNRYHSRATSSVPTGNLGQSEASSQRVLQILPYLLTNSKEETDTTLEQRRPFRPEIWANQKRHPN